MSIQQSLEQRNQITKPMNDPDRLFLLSLIDDLKQVPADKKMEYYANNFKCKISLLIFHIHTPIINQYSDLYQRTPSYPNFQTPYSDIHQLKNSQQNDQHRRFRTPTPSPGQNILSHSELEGSQSSSSSLATYIIYNMTLDTNKFIIEIEKHVELWDTGNSQRSDECIDFTMMYVFFFAVSVYSITSRNNASISNFGGGSRWESEYPWCIIKFKFLRNLSKTRKFAMQELQRKWKSLRNSFSREQAKRKNLKSGSGRTTRKTYPTSSNLSPSHNSLDENDFEEVNNDFNETTGEVLENVLRHKSAKKQKTVENEFENKFFNSVTKSLQEKGTQGKNIHERPRSLVYVVTC
ncbi:hypothetical protein AGLY_016639 [Aphis glycines]|uniref:BESS domain-containing protein n=1 Tax=Aphis glycines TaxID=307491 RepID=A0A6G0SXX9_APHGL|nr:hypothetical protein AGLY_016639 [Aphis glycines]